MIPGEGPTAAVGAVLAGRQPHDQQTRPGVAEGRHRQAAVGRMLSLDPVEKGREARAAAATGVENLGHAARSTQIKTGYVE